MAEDTTEFIKLPLLQRCTHKLWKARVHGYNEAADLFQKEDGKSAVFGQYLGLVHQFVSDSNAAAQEKGLEATLYFVENAAVAGKTAKDVMSAIIAKSIAAPKKNAQELSLKITLMYIEIEKQEAVVEELCKGLEHKNPKIIIACLTTLTTCLREFGSQVVGIKPLIKPIQNLMEDRDKTVREETKALLIEIYRWIGDAIKPLLSKFKPVQLTDLDAEFAKIRGGSKARPTRYLRSQQAKAEKNAATTDDADDENDALVEEEVIDPLSLIESINILSKIPKDFYDKVEAKKWQERKEALESLDKILDYPKFEKGDYGELVRALLKIVNKDSNVVVVGIATKCVARLALGLNKNFHPYASATLAPLLAKFKEKKANVVTPLREAVDAIFPSTNVEAIMEDIIESLDSKNPSIKAETAAFIGRCFAQCTPTELNKKLLKPYVTALLKTLNESDPNVRDSSAEALGIAMKVVSEKIIMPFFGDIDAIKLSKIKECSEKAVVKVSAIKKKPEPVKKSKPLKVEPKQIQYEETPVENDVEEDNRKANDKIDITNKLTNKLITELSDKNWKTRYDALLSVQAILMDTKIRPNLVELPAILVQRFVDSNSKIIATAFEVCGHLAISLGTSSKSYVQTFIRGILSALGDSKQPVRIAAMTCLKTWTNEAGAKEILCGEVIPDILKTSSNVLKNEVWTWLAELLPTVKGLPKEELCLLIPCLFLALEDRSADVRKAGNNAVFGLMMQVGYQNMIKDAEKLKPVSKPGIIQTLDRVRPDVPEIEPANKVNEAMGKMPPPKSAPNNNGNKKVRNSICPPAAKPNPKKEEESDGTALLLVNKLKNQRVLDEQKLKILKWNFTVPRQEFVDLLKDQMTLAGFNKTLIVNMFHIDFKFHIKAIESLIEDLYNQEALMSNLDLILKWMTLRFFDTNPSVLLKGLEYLQSAFSILIDREYTMFDLEANSFVPYLIMKIGDPKDTVRDRVRTILRQFSLMIPPGKLFVHVMDGLKSKNSRLRSESLDELGYLIEQFGTSVCLPSSAVALKEISKQIADRNNAVRSAALNTIVKAYFVDGDKIYKQIGKLSDKDMCYLEERIKRTSQNRTKMLHDLTNVTAKSLDSVKGKKPEAETEKIEEDDVNNSPIVEKSLTPPKSSPIIVKQASPKPDFPNPFKEYWDIKNPVVDLSKFDINMDESFLYEPIYIPENIYTKLKYKCPPNQALEEMFKNISSDNINIALKDLKKLERVFDSDFAQNLDNYSNGIFDALVYQLQKANTYDFANHGLLLGQLYKMIFKNIDNIYKCETVLAKRAEKSHIQDLIYQLLIALVEGKTELFEASDLNQWIMIFIANIIENSNTTKVSCALIESLGDLMLNLPKNFHLIDFYTKCILKTVLIIKNSDNLDEIVNLNDVLYTCHLFIEKLPRSAWQNYPSNIPFKAFNTLIVNLVQIKGTKILTYLKNIENQPASEFVSYLKKIVKQITNMRNSEIKLSENVSNSLAEIFKMIADENSKDGLDKLYEFKKNNPDVRLSSILSSTSLNFQQFISDGLKKIEKERGTSLEITHSVENSFSNFELEELPSDPADQPLYYFYKLKMYQRRLGYPESVLADFCISTKGGRDV